MFNYITEISEIPNENKLEKTKTLNFVGLMIHDKQALHILHVSPSPFIFSLLKILDSLLLIFEQKKQPNPTISLALLILSFSQQLRARSYVDYFPSEVSAESKLVTSLSEIGEEEMADTTDLKVCEHVFLFSLYHVVFYLNFLHAISLRYLKAFFPCG